MSLRIDRFNTTCHVPAQRRSDAEVVDRLARGRFARDLGEHLGPSLVRQPAIIRIRLLPMRVIVPAAELNEDALSLRWRHEFGKALFTALAYPAGTGPLEVFRADSIAGFVALAIRDLLDGTAPTKWQYGEFEPFFRLGSTQAALALICEWPRQSLAVLLHLAEQNALSRLLARFDDSATEHVISILAPSTETQTRTLSIADLIAVAKLALEHLPDKPLALRTRAYALNLFVEAQRARQASPSPRLVFHALLALAVLLNEDVFWPGIPHDHTRSGLPPSIYAAILESIDAALRESMQSASRNAAQESMHPAFGLKTPCDPQTQRGTITPQLAELDQLLRVLRVELKVPPPSAKPLPSRWISSDWCGLFFLSSTLERLGWVAAWGKLMNFQAGGAGCLVAGLALTIAGGFDPTVPSLDPAIALFAGYLDEPDLVHARRVFQEFPGEARLELLLAALPHENVDNAAETWEATFERLAETLLRTFASRIRGFRQATRQGIVRSLIARPGRIRIEPERLVVFPVPSPFNVALHISGMDDPVVSYTGLGGRRIEFELGDL